MTLIKVKTRGTDNVSSRKNLLINGGMLVDQRASTMQFNASSGYRCDRWYQGVSGGGTYQFTHSDDTPAGFGKSIKIQCTTADTSLDASAYGYIMHKLEGNALQSMNSTNGIVEHTISFYAKASKTGVYTVNLRDEDNSLQNSKTFTISTADTWERYVLTFPAHSSGTLDNDNLSSYRLYWWFQSGTDQTSGTFYNGTWGAQSNPKRVSSSNVNLGDSTSNNFFITGVQLEVGDSASDFEHRSFAEELQLCQRYFQRTSSGGQVYFAVGHVWSSTLCQFQHTFPTRMRAHPSLSTSGTIQNLSMQSAVAVSSTAIDDYSGSGYTKGHVIKFNGNMSSSGYNTGYACALLLNSNGAYIQFDAEI